jgi:hypothetical protein
MPELIYALFELIFAFITGRGKPVGEARKELTELFQDAPQKDKLLLLFMITFLITAPVLIIILLI